MFLCALNYHGNVRHPKNDVARSGSKILSEI